MLDFTIKINLYLKSNDYRTVKKPEWFKPSVNKFVDRLIQPYKDKYDSYCAGNINLIDMMSFNEHVTNVGNYGGSC